MAEARSEILRWMSRAVNPRVWVGTRKPRIPSSVCAQTTARSASVPFVIQSLLPLRTQSSPRRRALVRMCAGSEPKSGSVRPKQPMTSPRAIRGRYRSFCSSDPYFQIGNMQSEPWTETKLRNPESPASSSRLARP